MIRRLLRRSLRDTRGLALVEFALVSPILLIMLTALLELANYALVRQQISQLALQVADNAARIGDRSATGPLPLRESQINDVLLGSQIQGDQLDLADKGRILLSSLEVNPQGGQWLRWQRCAGGFAHPSSWGTQGDGATGSGFPGMGPEATRMTADPDNQVMFVEIAYDYRPLLGALFLPEGPMVEIAALPVRNDRDTSPITNAEGVTPSSC